MPAGTWLQSIWMEVLQLVEALIHLITCSVTSIAIWMTTNIRACSIDSMTREDGLYAASIAPPNRFAVMAARLHATSRAITGKTCVNTLERYGHIYASILKKHITLMTS